MKTQKTKGERSLLYDKVYDDFIKLINKEIDEVIISNYEMYELTKTHYWSDTDGLIIYGIHRNNTYADALKENFKSHNIIQTLDLIKYNYIFRLGGNKDE